MVARKSVVRDGDWLLIDEGRDDRHPVTRAVRVASVQAIRVAGWNDVGEQYSTELLLYGGTTVLVSLTLDAALSALREQS